MNMFNQEIIHHLGLTLLHFIWQGLLAGLVYGLILLVWRPASASARYNLALATLVTLAALPALTLWWLIRAAETTASALVDMSDAVGSGAAAGTLPGMAHDPMAWIVVAWLAGVSLLSARLVMGWHYVQQLRRSADHAATAALADLVEQTRQRLAIGRRVVLAASNRVRAPLVIGWLKPLILFPPAMVNQLPLAQIEMVLAHEMAHIRRHDHLVNLFQTVVETLLFYHPVVAWVSRQIRIERENACDDLAVEITENRLGYVEMLASLEHLRQPRARLALSINDGQILGRIRRLVEPSQPGRQRGLTLPAVALVSLVAATTAIYLVPESEPVETPMPVATSVANPAPAAARVNSNDSAPGTAESIDDPLSWDFPDPLPPVSDRATRTTPGTGADRPAPRPVAADQESRAPTEPEPAPPAAAEVARADAASAEPDPAQVADTTAEPGVNSALQLAALPVRQAARPAPPTIAEIEPPPISGGELVHRVEPRFPTRARQRQASGLVELEFTVAASGQTSDIEIVEETPARFGFGHAARAAVAQWRFEPFRQGETQVSRRVRMEIEFSPEDGCLEILGSRIPRC
ncbi:MAG: TonB family protein [Wenzhouxiangella sp.]|nr:MAG: TonB family protein [Wenzhouxiangella sp.]